MKLVDSLFPLSLLEEALLVPKLAVVCLYQLQKLGVGKLIKRMSVSVCQSDCEEEENLRAGG